MFLVFVLNILLICCPVYDALSLGEICKLADNTQGVCKHIHDCTSALTELRMNKRPKTCGFERFVPIVCCRYSSSPADEEETPDYGKVSAQMCENYAGLVFQNHSSPTLLPDVLFEIEDTCAIKQENYEESNVLAREFPHSASIGYDDATGQVWKCAGALISDQYVLTSASCSVLPKLGTAQYVRIGSTNAKENFYHEKPLQYFKIRNFIKHPRYDQSTSAHNLALIRLDTPVQFTSIVRPACLGVNKNWTQKMINMGWGTIHHNGYMNNEPLKNLLRVVDQDRCDNLSPRQYCVEQIRGTLWQNCLADQGGPLLASNEDNYCTYNIVGVVSSWEDCYTNKPGIYTNVTAYIPWIEKIVWERHV